MKTKQFFKEIRLMGFDVKDLNNVIVIIDSNEYYIAEVSKDNFGAIATDYPMFCRLDYNTKLQLLNLLIDYTKTPIEYREDREHEKLYFLKQKGVRDKYLTYVSNTGEYTTESKYYVSIRDSQKLFTQSEIDNMEEYYTDPTVWEQIELEAEIIVD